MSTLALVLAVMALVKVSVPQREVHVQRLFIEDRAGKVYARMDADPGGLTISVHGPGPASAGTLLNLRPDLFEGEIAFIGFNKDEKHRDWTTISLLADGHLKVEQVKP